MSKEKVLIFVQPGCEKCKIAKDIVKKLDKEKYEVTELNIETVDGLTEFTYYGFQYPPAIVVGSKKYSSVMEAKKELL